MLFDQYLDHMLVKFEQWRSQGLPERASRPPGRLKWGRKRRKIEEKWEKLQENEERLRKSSYLAHPGVRGWLRPWIWTKSYGPNYTKYWAFWQKMVNHFWQNVDTFLEDVSVTETIVWGWTINSKTIILQCSKNYGNSTRVTRLKVKPNMADPIFLKRDRSLKPFNSIEILS